MKSDGSKKINNGAGHAYVGGRSHFGTTPIKSKVILVPDTSNLSFLQRLKKWLTD